MDERRGSPHALQRARAVRTLWDSLGADGVGGLTALPVMTHPVNSAAIWVKQGAGVDNKSES